MNQKKTDGEDLRLRPSSSGLPKPPCPFAFHIAYKESRFEGTDKGEGGGHRSTLSRGTIRDKLERETFLDKAPDTENDTGQAKQEQRSMQEQREVHI